MTDSPAFVPEDVPVEPGSPMRRWRQRIGYDMAVMDLGGRGLALIGGLILLAWISSGIYKVQPDEQGIVLRFGRWQQTAESGLHYHLPFPVETVLLPKITQVNQLQLGSGSSTQGSASNGARDKQMLTGDENIVEADCTVFWRIKDARLYLFKISDPERSVKLAAESALREVIGRTPIQAVMSDKRAQIADETRDLLQQLLDREQAGILITQVQLQRVDPPPQVIDAFNDVQRARADQERSRNEAEAYANDIIPRARGDASRITQEAEAYQAQVGNLAEGEAKRFLSVYNSYVQSKDVTAWRLYMESMDEVLKKASKVIIDSSGKGMSGVVPYLPLNDAGKSAAKEVRP
ncbi:FtsH protease activity modulator HflK [Pseudomonas sp. TH03]|uniref:FtsH protease activity modulator HflK n=1 Tax=Pseudomonas sp. TH03 TaxID=2796369 RepID=UPI00191345F0|nr:FtsH protease activity modulator HflK [Pseudomonas sp. TH03]MBK5550187.1 FtsH protease activity modulator HflK [Pseudomonas sp. TH03]